MPIFVGLLVTWQHDGCHGNICKKLPPSYMMGADMTTAAFKQQTNTLVRVGANRIRWIPSYIILSEIIVYCGRTSNFETGCFKCQHCLKTLACALAAMTVLSLKWESMYLCKTVFMKQGQVVFQQSQLGWCYALANCHRVTKCIMISIKVTLP